MKIYEGNKILRKYQRNTKGTWRKYYGTTKGILKVTGILPNYEGNIKRSEGNTKEV